MKVLSICIVMLFALATVKIIYERISRTECVTDLSKNSNRNILEIQQLCR